MLFMQILYYLKVKLTMLWMWLLKLVSLSHKAQFYEWSRNLSGLYNFIYCKCMLCAYLYKFDVYNIYLCVYSSLLV